MHSNIKSDFEIKGKYQLEWKSAGTSTYMYKEDSLFSRNQVVDKGNLINFTAESYTIGQYYFSFLQDLVVEYQFF